LRYTAPRRRVDGALAARLIRLTFGSGARTVRELYTLVITNDRSRRRPGVTVSYATVVRVMGGETFRRILAARDRQEQSARELATLRLELMASMDVRFPRRRAFQHRLEFTI
jgi:hypothetical protein